MSSTPAQTSVTVSFVMGSSAGALGFYGETGATKATLGTTAAAETTISALTSSTPFGFASKADGDEMLANLELIRLEVAAIKAALVAVNLVDA